MAITSAASFANSLISLNSHRPYPNASSIPRPNTLSIQFDNKKNQQQQRRHARVTTFCSSDAAPKDPIQDKPIELRYQAFPTVMDINQIRDILPHRFPFLLVDRVIEYNPGVSAVAIKNVTINDNFFPGHFPERPIMPGVLMVEGSCKALTATTSAERDLPWLLGLPHHPRQSAKDACLIFGYTV